MKPITPAMISAARLRPWQEFFQRHGIFSGQRTMLTSLRRGEVTISPRDVPRVKTAETLERRGLATIQAGAGITVRITPTGMLLAEAVEEMEGRRNRIVGGSSPDVDGYEG